MMASRIIKNCPMLKVLNLRLMAAASTSVPPVVNPAAENQPQADAIKNAAENTVDQRIGGAVSPMGC